MIYNIPYTKLNDYKYPNLVAEVIETGYSLCTVSDHMGLGACKENDPVICGKIFGNKKILLSEGIGLCRLFDCEAGYLFAKELVDIEGKPMAYYRHCKTNKRLRESSEHQNFCSQLRIFLDNNPDLFSKIKEMVKLNRDYVEKFAELAA